MSPVQPIEAYLRGGEPDAAVRAAVQQVGAQGPPEAGPLLRQVAETASTTGNRKVIFDALDGLRRLGAPRDYFVEAARGHAGNKWLAYHAIIVLARDAAEDGVWEELRAIRSQTSDAALLGAVALAERVRYLESEYQAIPDLAGRLRYVLDTFRTEWNPIKLAGGEGDRGTNPQAVWGQQRLRALSEQDPQAAAAAVATADKPGLRADYLPAYRRFVAQFLADEAQQRFRQLDREG